MTTSRTYIIAGLLVAIAVLWRIANWHYAFAPNLELVTTATILAALWLPRRYALYVPLVAVVASDAVIGNSPILLFTWSAWAIIGLSALILRSLLDRPIALVVAGLGGAVAGSIFFFAYTNFGVWLIGSLYPHTLQGLITSFAMGLPFYRTMILGNVVMVPLAISTSLAIATYLRAVDTHSVRAQSYRQ